MMSWTDILGIVGIWLLSTVKFVFGAVPLALSLGFSFWQTIVVTCSGGFVGVLLFVNLSEWIINKLKERKLKKNAAANSHKKFFTRRNKLIVIVKRKFGLAGIALMTPFLLSIPLGCFVAVRYFHHKNKIIFYMFMSIVFWSVSISSYRLFFP